MTKQQHHLNHGENARGGTIIKERAKQPAKINESNNDVSVAKGFLKVPVSSRENNVKTADFPPRLTFS